MVIVIRGHNVMKKFYLFSILLLFLFLIGCSDTPKVIGVVQAKYPDAQQVIAYPGDTSSYSILVKTKNGDIRLVSFNLFWCGDEIISDILIFKN